MRRALLPAACLALVSALPLAAHHSFAAEYDGSKPVTLKGKVTKVDWVNPHSWIYIDVTGEDGKVVNWSCETAPPNGLYRQGWRRDTLKPGDQVSVEGFLAKDGSHTMTARSVETPDGRRLFAGSANDGGPQSQKSPSDK
ncbi:MAG TPA: DUF6152 family protein [Bryobacteraceae bacterium]|nr:DUF6152 family protein [Bryobacteraceae bacterium]